MPNYCDGSDIRLILYANKDASAWTEVWTGTWPSRASITVPVGRSGWETFEDFWQDDDR